jgi:DNA repair exonuclease SbcCD ATPase subunit
MRTVFVRAEPPAGFHRAGRFWPNSWTQAEVSEEDLAKLEAEPRLSVRYGSPDDPGALQTLRNLLEQARSERDRACTELATIAPLAERSKEAIVTLHGRIAELEAKLSNTESNFSALKSEHEKCAAALKSAQESCAKLREENKALKSKKDPPPSAPAPAAEAKSEDKAA